MTCLRGWRHKNDLLGAAKYNLGGLREDPSGGLQKEPLGGLKHDLLGGPVGSLKFDIACSEP